MNAIEQWRDVAGFEGLYQVSDAGRAKSLPRIVPGRYGSQHVRGRILKPQSHKVYLYVYLRKNGETHTCLVHRLVAEAFIPNPENKPQVNHIEKPKNNNAASNLEWATRAEDDAHALANGLYAKGSTHGNSTLNTKQVIEMRKLRKQGWKLKSLATMFGTCFQNVSDIVADV